MSLLTATAVAVLGTFAMGMPSAHAIDAKCMYPPTRPVISIGLSTSAPTAGAPLYLRGRLSYNKCGVPGAAVSIRGGSKTVGGTKTNAAGDYSYRIKPTVNGSYAANSSFNRIGAGSRVLNIAVRTNIRGTKVAAVGSCRATVRGSIFPARKGASLLVQQRVMTAKKFLGWKTVGTARTDARGNYSTTVTLPCGSKTGLSVFIAPTKINAGNRTATVTVAVK